MPELKVWADFSKFGEFSKTLDTKAASGFRRGIRKAVTEVGHDALERMKTEANTFSHGATSTPKNPHTSIADATSLKVSFAARSAGVKIRTDSKKAPHARLYEHGSKNSGGAYIRHPVWGSKRDGAPGDVRARYEHGNSWRNIPTHKFFYKAVWGHRDELKNKIDEQVTEVARELGFTR